MGVTASNVAQKQGEVRELETLLEKGGAVARHCDVCLILDGDSSPKPVKYCKLCDKFMCDTCRVNWARRTAAATAYKVKQFLGGFRRGQAV